MRPPAKRRKNAQRAPGHGGRPSGFNEAACKEAEKPPQLHPHVVRAPRGASMRPPAKRRKNDGMRAELRQQVELLQ